MFHRHHKTTSAAAATTGAVTGAATAASTGLGAPLGTGVAAPGIVPVAPAPPGPILAVPLVAAVPAAAPPALPSVAAKAPQVLEKAKEGVKQLPGAVSGLAKELTNRPSLDTKAPTTATLLPVGVAPVSIDAASDFSTQQQFPQQQLPLTKEAPLQHLVEERPAVIKEKIIPIEEETIQPFIHREVERREIHEVLQPIHERQVLPTTFEDKQLQAEYRPVIGGYVPRSAPVIQPTVEYATPERVQVMRAPIIEETIKRTVIEEVQPIIHREVVKPHIIRQTQPIYERILEPEVILKETRPMIERSLPATNMYSGAGLQSSTSSFPTNTTAALPSSTMQEGKYVFEIDQKTKLAPVSNLPPTNVSANRSYFPTAK